MGKNKKNQILIGFAAETENLLDNAKNKLKKKNLDFIVANSAYNMQQDKNLIQIIKKNGEILKFNEAKERIVAKQIFSEIINEINK